MGFRDWLIVRRMTDPVEGVLRVADWYDPHPSSSGHRVRLTGVLTAPGVPPTPVDHLADRGGRWVGNSELPVLVDRANPTRYRILWKRVRRLDARATATRQAEEMARRLAAGNQPPGAQPYAGMAGLSPELNDLVNRAVSGQLADGGAEVQVTVHSGGLTGAEAARLLDRGQPARAVVTAVRDTSMLGMSLAELSLDVTLADGTRFPAHTNLGFSAPERRERIARTGAEIPVRVDPEDRSRVAVDTRALGYT